ncbi:MAG: ImmA/IrrE family metallo-endopeptidase [Magnetococcales bacterium]|nr:ImmA/IrrE family metallo-endopeptidase [Magnetococcales bacterium]
MSILIRNDPVWGQGANGQLKGIESYWDALLEHLAKAWPFLQAEEVYPLGFNPESPDQFLNEALAGLPWGKDPDPQVARDEQAIFAFAKRHDLASGMPDIHLPTICLMREGHEMRIVAETHDIRLPHDQALKRLEELGQAIARTVEARSPRGKIILEAWDQRDKPLEPERLLSIVMGMRPERLRTIAANDDLTLLFGQPSMPHPTPMQIAARMTHHSLMDDELRQVIGKVAKLRMTKADKKFVNLQKEAERKIGQLASLKPYDQGYQLARWLRQSLGTRDDRQVDPENLLIGWGTSVVNTRCPEVIDAIARWDGDQMGILVNRRGMRARTDWGRRASLAHEIAHLLIDTLHALPSVEILGGRMPLHVEQRANAFAAEFLLPRSQVDQAVPQSPTPRMLEPIIKELSNIFSVGQILASRQIENLLMERGQLDQQVRIFLDRIADRYANRHPLGWLAI